MPAGTLSRAGSLFRELGGEIRSMAACDSAQQKSRAPYSRRWLVEALSAFDDRQRRRQAVFEYTRNPACVFRLDITRAAYELTLRDGTLVRPGDRVARLHFWNEQIPTLPEDGATIAWARRMQRAIGVSLDELAHYLAGRPDLADIAVVCGLVPSATKSQSGQLARIMAYYGFETIPGAASAAASRAPAPAGRKYPDLIHCSCAQRRRAPPGHAHARAGADLSVAPDPGE